jgi:AICAR transformylase/IMP cyclohydrolase PurH
MVPRWPLKYGLNPHQASAFAEFPSGHEWLEVLNGEVGYVNLLDALRAWTLARELGDAFGTPSAASVKHVHPAGAAVAGALEPPFRAAHVLGDDDYSPLATAYARARAGDRTASFGDFIGLSAEVDVSCARLIGREVSDGIIAPSYAPDALAILRRKKNGRYVVLRADPAFAVDTEELRRENGLELHQAPNHARITSSLFRNVVSRATALSPEETADLRLATIVVKHTPSNAVCVAHEGQAIGIGGGQQARIYATRSACEKADLWRLQVHPRAASLVAAESVGRTERFNLVRQWLLWDELSTRERTRLEQKVPDMPRPLTAEERDEWIRTFACVMSSDGYIPFADNIERAARSAVRAVAQPGGSAHDPDVTATADELGVVMIHTGVRLFWH